MFQTSKLTWRDSIRMIRSSRRILVRASSELFLSRLDEIARFEICTAGASITVASPERAQDGGSAPDTPPNEHRRDYTKHSLGPRHHGSL